MPYDYQAALNRIEDKIDLVDSKLDAHLLSHAEAKGRTALLGPVVKATATVATSVAASLIIYSLIG